ncbi:MAG: hypothetical protein ACRDKU_03595, partial [Gaiellaceae bacterium]
MNGLELSSWTHERVASECRAGPEDRDGEQLARTAGEMVAVPDALGQTVGEMLEAGRQCALEIA